MLSSAKFSQRSLSLHLFFARIMKEHSFFLGAGFAPKDTSFTQQADSLRLEFDGILAEAISLSNGVVSPEVFLSGEIITPYTLNAEIASTYFTGVQIPIQLTQAAAGLAGGNITANPMLEQRVFALNQRTIKATAALIQFKTKVYSSVLSCRMFTFNYPSLIVHITREAELYLAQLKRLQNRERINTEKEISEQELFWSGQMVEHLEFIRGLLDPTESNLISQANILINQFNNLGKNFDQLTEAARAAIDMTTPSSEVTNKKLKAAVEIQNFKAQGTKGILACKIKSMIIPLLGDHVLREANHYLRLLKMSERVLRHFPPPGQ